MQNVFFGLGLQYDTGSIPSVGINVHGTVLEVHKNELGLSLYYHIGALDGATVTWGPSRQYDTGTTPQCALNAGNVVVEVHKNEAGSTLYYHVGHITGDAVTWSASRKYDSGITPAVALNDAGIVVEVHKTQSPLSNGLYYHVGHVNGDAVSWSSSHQYDSGDTPKVALNNNNIVVEVHKSPSSSALWYRVGGVNGDAIAFGASVEFASGSNPSVALRDDGFVIVIWSNGTSLMQRSGRVNGQQIDWNGDAAQFDDGTNPSVAAAGGMSIQVHEGETLKTLWASTSLIMDRAAWMQGNLGTLGQRPLSALVLPASHDAGMYLGGASLLGKTQDLSIYGQLSHGVRWFDIRPRWTGEKFILYHGPIPGPDLAEVLNDIRSFALEGHRELMIFKLSHFDSIDSSVYEKLVKQISDSIGPWLYRALPSGKRLADVTLGEYVASGPVCLLVVDGNYAADAPTPGFWVYRDWDSGDPARGDLRALDVYSNTTDFDAMKADQLAKFESYNGTCKNAPSVPCDMFLLSWTLTPITAVWLYAKTANRALGASMAGLSIPNQFGRIVNMLYVDYVQYARVADVALIQNGVHP